MRQFSHPSHAQDSALLAPTLLRHILQSSGWHQAALGGLSVIVFVLNTVPLELQRRIVDLTVYEGKIGPILLLCGAYAGVALLEGLFKLLLNVYRGWVGENSVREIRNGIARIDPLSPERPDLQGVESALILTEADPIGGFVGTCVSEPLLQGGIWLSVFGYMLVLQPKMALIALLVFTPQMIFVPLMQKAINRRIADRVTVLRDVGGDVLSADRPNDIRRGRIDEIFTLNMCIYKLKYAMNFGMNFVHHLGVVAILAVGGWYVTRGTIEIGTVVAFVSGLVKVNDPWGDIVNWYRDLTVTRIKYRMIVEAAERLHASGSPDGS